ncbi:MAG: MATE family efflux transporter [Lactobacillales bacterium]|nr:MATE family efflux transporter [Lactobacillales bacterium]
MEAKNRRIFAIAIPATIDNVLQNLVLFVDGLLIAKISLSAVAGIGIANSILAIYLAVFIAVSVGASALVSQALGGNKRQEIAKSSGQAVFLVCIVGIVFGLISCFFATPILKIMGAEATTFHDAKIFLCIVGGTSIFQAFQNIFASLLRATEDARTPMKVSLFVNLFNVGLDLVLIFGFGPIPALGVLGAAIATSIARAIGAGWLFLSVQKSSAKFSIHDFLNFHHYKKLVNLSIPAALERLVMRVGQVVYFTFIVAMGSNVFASHMIAANIESFTYMPGFGLAAAATTLAGMSLGAGEKEEVCLFTKKAIYIGVISMSFLGIVEFIGAPWFASWFTSNVSAIQKIVIALRIDAFIQPILAINLIVIGALQGMGDTKGPFYSTAIGMWVIRVFLVWFLGLKMRLGIAGVWLAIGVDVFMRTIFLVWRFQNDLSKNQSTFNQKKVM